MAVTEATIQHTPKGLAPAPLIAMLAAGALTAFAPQIFNDGDTFMHVAAGQPTQSEYEAVKLPDAPALKVAHAR